MSTEDLDQARGDFGIRSQDKKSVDPVKDALNTSPRYCVIVKNIMALILEAQILGLDQFGGPLLIML